MFYPRKRTCASYTLLVVSYVVLFNFLVITLETNARVQRGKYRGVGVSDFSQPRGKDFSALIHFRGAGLFVFIAVSFSCRCMWAGAFPP